MAERKKTHNNRIWIIVAIVAVVSIFTTIVAMGYWTSYEDSMRVSQEDMSLYRDTSSRLLEEAENLENKLNEAYLSFGSLDAITARNRISESKAILVGLKADYEFVCNFQRAHRNLFSNVTDSYLKECDGWAELYKVCFTKYLDSFYNSTYLIDQTNQIETQEDLSDYRSSCNSWLNDYNTARGSCNTIIELNSLSVEPFRDLSYVCDV